MGSIKSYYTKQNEARKRIEVPEWGISFFVGPLTVKQFERISEAESDSERNRLVIATCAKDSENAPALSPEDQDELAAYGTVDVVSRVAAEIMEACNALRGDQEKKA